MTETTPTPPAKGKALTGEELAFLDLPASKLALTLQEKAQSTAAPKHRIIRWFMESKGRLIALSALIAALLPLYELNQGAWRYLEARLEVARLVVRAEKLMAVDAAQDAEQVLSRARSMREGDLGIARLQAALDIERALRKNQTPSSLRALEIQYGDVLNSDARSNYLLGTAWVNVDPARADALFDQADRLNHSKVPQTQLLVYSGRIWSAARKAERADGPSRKLLVDQADALYAKAQALMQSNGNVDFESASIPLNHSYAMILEQKDRDGDEQAGAESLALQRRVVATAMSTGNPITIGKAMGSLAAKLKDIGLLRQARTTVQASIRYATLADDARGLYNDQYTLGQIELLSGNFDAAEMSFTEAIKNAERNGDIRIQNFAFSVRGQTRLQQGRTAEALDDIQQAGNLAQVLNDHFGINEAEFLAALSSLLGAATDAEHVAAVQQLERLRRPGVEDVIQASAKWWFDTATGHQPTSRPALVYDDDLEMKLVKLWKAKPHRSTTAPTSIRLQH
jgi:hypothetical protein